MGVASRTKQERKVREDMLRRIATLEREAAAPSPLWKQARDWVLNHRIWGAVICLALLIAFLQGTFTDNLSLRAWWAATFRGKPGAEFNVLGRFVSGPILPARFDLLNGDNTLEHVNCSCRIVNADSAPIILKDGTVTDNTQYSEKVLPKGSKELTCNPAVGLKTYGIELVIDLEYSVSGKFGRYFSLWTFRTKMYPDGQAFFEQVERKDGDISERPQPK
jgi:hypothetical protein